MRQPSRHPALTILATTGLFVAALGWGKSPVRVGSAAFPAAAADALTSLSKSAPYIPAELAFSLFDPQTSRVVYEMNGAKSVVPASCMKAISTATCLHHLGPDHRFTTRFEAVVTPGTTGSAEHIVIRGGGDPTLGSDRVPGSPKADELAAAVVEAARKAGIIEVRGDIVADDSYFPYEPVPDGWEWEDIANYYGAGPSGLCFHDNMYLLAFEPGPTVGSPASILRVTPPLPGVEWINGMKTGPAGSGDNGWIYGAPGTGRRWLRGTIPQGKPFEIKGSMPDPGAALAEMLRVRLQAAGIRCSGGARSTEGKPFAPAGPAVPLLEHQSPPLLSILRILNKQSFNLYAEMMLMNTAKAAGDGTRASGLKEEERFLRSLGTPLSGFSIRDGSGLSRGNTVTATGMAAFMAGMMREPHFEAWKQSLPILGVDGDLGGRETSSPLRGKVHAKTGLITRVRGLTGYLETRSGRTFTFGFFANDYQKSWVEVDKDMDRVLRLIYDRM